jgi:hypothetical protein
MKFCKIFLILILILTSKLIFSQQIDAFLDYYSFNKMVHSGTANDYQGIDGNPYLDSQFADGICYLKDTTAVKLPLRYNIYADAMEYRLKDVTYSINNIEKLNNVFIGESVFVYLPFIQKGGYFQVYEPGKCLIAQKRSVKFKDAEAAKPIEAVSKPPRFVNEKDKFYIVFSQSRVYKVTNKKSVLIALNDQKTKVASFMNQEKINKPKKESLIKIVRYYNNL